MVEYSSTSFGKEATPDNAVCCINFVSSTSLNAFIKLFLSEKEFGTGRWFWENSRFIKFWFEFILKCFAYLRDVRRESENDTDEGSFPDGIVSLWTGVFGADEENALHSDFKNGDDAVVLDGPMRRNKTHPPGEYVGRWIANVGLTRDIDMLNSV